MLARSMLRCFSLAVGLVLHVSALQQQGAPMMHNTVSAPDFAASASLQLQSISSEDFVAMSSDLALESIISRMLYPAAATVTKVVDAPHNVEQSGGLPYLAVDVEILPLTPNTDMVAFEDNVRRVLNSRDFVDQMEAAGMHFSHPGAVQVELQQRSLSPSLADQALEALKSLMPDAAAASVLFDTNAIDPAAVDNNDSQEAAVTSARFLQPQLPEDVAKMIDASSREFSSSHDSPFDAQIDGDLVIMSRLPASMALQQSIAQPVVALAADIARDMWQAVQQAKQLAVQQLQQLHQSVPFSLREVEVTVEHSHGISSTASTKNPAVERLYKISSPDAIASSGTSSNAQTNADMEVSVTVESSRPRPMLPLLRGWQGQTAAIESSQQAAEIASAVLSALGVGAEQEAEDGTAVPVGEQSQEAQQRLETMLKELREKGSYDSTFESDSAEDLSATAAAAVAAAASTLQEDPWSSMEMEVEVTRTTQKIGFTWAQISIIVGAMVVTHIGLFLLVAPLYAKYTSREDGEEENEQDEECGGGKPRQQFVVASLAEAGMYRRLLSDPGTSCSQ